MSKKNEQLSQGNGEISQGIEIATAETSRSNRLKHETTTWKALIERLKKPHRTHETFEQYTRMSKADKGRAKDVGGFIGGTFTKLQRKSINLKIRTLIVLDADEINDISEWEAAVELAYGVYHYISYTTHSHSTDKPRYRLVFLPDRPLLPEEYAPVARKLASRAGIHYFDPASYNGVQIMYWPSAASDGEFLSEVGVGDHVGVDDLLDEYADWKDASLWPRATKESDNVTNAVSNARKAEDPTGKDGVVGNFCRAFNIHECIVKFLSAEYEEYDRRHGRYSYIPGTSENGGITYDDKWMWSHHGSDPAFGVLCNSYDLVRIHRFRHLDARCKNDTHTHKLPSTKAMREFAESLPIVKSAMVASLSVDFDGIESEIEGTPTKPVTESWHKKLKAHLHGEGLEPSLVNTVLILTNDKDLKNTIQFNEMTKKQAVCNAPWNKNTDSVTGAHWEDSDDASLRMFIASRYGIEPSPRNFTDACDLIARHNKFHPLVDMIKKLKWDGIARLDTWLTEHMGVKDTPYTRAVGSKWLVGAVARAISPGCKFDYMLVLEGGQGKGKSKMVQNLCLHESFFSDALENTDGKSAVESLSGHNIVEMPELAVFRKRDIEHLKAFITRREDKARAAYARHVSHVPRQCVFVGTTNENNYLTDDTGNRRYWPVLCTKASFNDDKIITAREQLWAEAYVRYLAGEQLWLDPALEEVAKQEQKARHSEDPLQGSIEVWLREDTPQGIHTKNHDEKLVELNDADAYTLVPRTRVCVSEVYHACVQGNNGAKISKSDSIRIGKILNNIPFCYKPNGESGDNREYLGSLGRQRVWHLFSKELEDILS